MRTLAACSHPTKSDEPQMNANTRKLHDLGQRIWLDNITREMLNNGTLARYITELSVTGLTSNPTIFEQAIASGDLDDGAIQKLAAKGLPCEGIFFKLASEYCRRSQRKFMFELLVPPTDDQLVRAGGNKGVFDRQARPLLMQQALRVLQDAGIEPDVWKVEGLDSHADGECMVQIARRGGRDQVGCIVLGRGADEAQVRSWLTVAAGVPGFIGFAVGRTSFWDAVAGYRTQTLTRVEAATQIARRLREWVDVFEDGQAARAAGADRTASVPPRPSG